MEKRSYKEILGSVETHFIYINNHLDNIDKHLERQNNSLTDHEKSITKNKNNIGWIIRIGSGLLTIGSIVALVLKIAGFY